MTPIKRLEIVIDRPHLQLVLSTLERAGVEGYTVMREASGRGDRGVRLGDEVSDASSNCVIIAATPPDIAGEVIEALRPILRQVGGMCLMSDALWVRH